MIFIDNRLYWIVRSYYRLDCLSISIAKFYINWIGNPAEDYLKRMNPIAVALDKVQSDGCKLSDAVKVWKHWRETWIH